MKGLRLRKIVGLMFVAVGAAGVLVAHVWKQNTYVRLSKETVKVGQNQGRLRNEIALLEMEIGELRKLARIERVARGFGLEYGSAPVTVYSRGREVDAPGTEERVAGNGFGVRGTAGEEAPGGPAAQGMDAGKVAWPTKGL